MTATSLPVRSSVRRIGDLDFTTIEYTPNRPVYGGLFPIPFRWQAGLRALFHPVPVPLPIPPLRIRSRITPSRVPVTASQTQGRGGEAARTRR